MDRAIRLSGGAAGGWNGVFVVWIGERSEKPTGEQQVDEAVRLESRSAAADAGVGSNRRAVWDTGEEEKCQIGD